MDRLKKVKALALDLDGTLLLPGPVMGEKTAGILHRLAERGMRLIFCTGRSPESLEPYRLASGAEGPMVTFNGALTAGMYGTGTGPAAVTVLDTAFLPAEVVEYCIGAGEAAGVYVQIYARAAGGVFRAALLADRDCPEARLYRGHTGTVPRYGDLRAALRGPENAGWIKVMFISGEEDRLERVRAGLAARFGGPENGPGPAGTVYVTKSAPIFLEVLAAGAGKGAALARVMKRLGLPPEEVLACGDEENDLPLFAVAGHSAAPADAKPAVRAAAEFTTAPCGEEGVAAFLEKAFLT